MVILKSTEEIEKLRQSNLLVSKTLAELARYIEPGITTGKLNEIADEFIRDHNALPAFLGYSGFPKSICTSVNSEVVHGIPSDRILEDGDIISVDCGVILDGYVGDTAFTFEVGDVNEEVKRLMKTTREALMIGINNAVVGNRTGDIGYAIQHYCENEGYGVVRELVGHGIGKKLHEEPEVPNYGRRGTGIKLRNGIVICIEPMINLGKRNIIQDPDGWTIRTSDNKPSAHYELAIAIKDGEADVLSTFKYIEEVLN